MKNNKNQKPTYWYLMGGMSFLSEQGNVFILEGGKGTWTVFIQQSPWEVSMRANADGVRYGLKSTWKEQAATMTRGPTLLSWPCPCGKVFHRVLVSLSSPTLSFCVGCLFFEKLTQDHSCNVSFY
jgi:hypothetical protein